jgi:hypothetical protein
VSEYFTGLVPETGSQRAARLSEQIGMPVCAGLEVPEKLWDEPPTWNRVENQQRTNMCASNAGTTAIEVVSFQATGQMVQRSRNFLYAKAQAYCGLYGDRGVTLGSIIQALKNDGDCPEELFPFNGVFDSRIPPGCEAAAKECRVTATIDVHRGGYAAVRTLIGQNMGAVLMATEWPIDYSAGYIVEHYRPMGNGGHARCWMALAGRKDTRGRPYVWCANSHSTMAQHGGYELWSPAAIDEHLQSDNWGSTGITALSEITPQNIDWTGVLNPFAK